MTWFGNLLIRCLHNKDETMSERLTRYPTRLGQLMFLKSLWSSGYLAITRTLQPDYVTTVRGMNLPSAPSNIRLLLSRNVCIKGTRCCGKNKSHTLRVQIKVNLTKIHTISLLQTMAQETKLLKLKPGQTPGLNIDPCYRPDPAKIVDPETRDSVAIGCAVRTGQTT